jgi:hypothetical protein
LVSLGGVIGRLNVEGVRPAKRHFSFGRGAQELEFSLAQLAEARLRQSHEVLNRSPGILRRHRHLL